MSRCWMSVSHKLCVEKLKSYWGHEAGWRIYIRRFCVTSPTHRIRILNCYQNQHHSFRQALFVPPDYWIWIYYIWRFTYICVCDYEGLQRIQAGLRKTCYGLKTITWVNILNLTCLLVSKFPKKIIHSKRHTAPNKDKSIQNTSRFFVTSRGGKCRQTSTPPNSNSTKNLRGKSASCSPK